MQICCYCNLPVFYVLKYTSPYFYLCNKHYRACIQSHTASLTITCTMCTSTRTFHFPRWRKITLPGGVGSRYVPFRSWPPSLAFCVTMAEVSEFTPSFTSPMYVLMAADEKVLLLFIIVWILKKHLWSFMLKFGYCIISVPTLNFLGKVSIPPHAVSQFLPRGRIVQFYQSERNNELLPPY